MDRIKPYKDKKRSSGAATFSDLLCSWQLYQESQLTEVK